MKLLLLFAGDACDFRRYSYTLTVKKLGSYLTPTETSSQFTEIEFLFGFLGFFFRFLDLGPPKKQNYELLMVPLESAFQDLSICTKKS